MQHTPLSQDSTERRERRLGLRSPATAWSLIFTAVLFAGVFTSEPPQAAAPRATSVQVVQQVVERQLQALSAQDAASAFALADPVLRTQFGNAESFLDTVREQYPMLMQASSVLFLKPETDGTVAMQKVRITDVEGSSWSLTYLLNRQQDDQWRISGCVVTPEGKQILT
ncbi:MAG TPA: DUF4864 domain-containing protein [Ramlibacter sp.]|nr:DUF4864 domain-containing protein [Ramlibacter sp.]